MSGQREVSGVRCQVSGGNVVTTKNYMDVEDRGQNLEVGGRKSEVGREGFSCGSGFQPRFDYRAGPLMLDEVSVLGVKDYGSRYSFYVSFP